MYSHPDWQDQDLAHHKFLKIGRKHEVESRPHIFPEVGVVHVPWLIRAPFNSGHSWTHVLASFKWRNARLKRTHFLASFERRTARLRRTHLRATLASRTQLMAALEQWTQLRAAGWQRTQLRAA